MSLEGTSCVDQRVVLKACGWVIPFRWRVGTGNKVVISSQNRGIQALSIVNLQGAFMLWLTGMGLATRGAKSGGTEEPGSQKVNWPAEIFLGPRREIDETITADKSAVNSAQFSAFTIFMKV